MLAFTTLTTRTATTTTGYTLSGLVGGSKDVNTYNSAGTLLEQDFFTTKTSMFKYIHKADGCEERHLFLNGKEYQMDTFNASNKMTASTLYTKDAAAAMAILTQASEALRPKATYSELVQDVMGSLLHNTDTLSLVGVTPIPTSFA